MMRMASSKETQGLYTVAAALLVLLALTVGLYWIDLGPLNFPLAMLIAIMKALLVLIFFMELRKSRAITWIFAAASVGWLILLVGGILVDVVTRHVLIVPHP